MATRRVTVRGEGFALAGEVGPGESWAGAAARVAAPLEQAGFSVQVGGFGLETSLRAVFGTGSLSVGI